MINKSDDDMAVLQEALLKVSQRAKLASDVIIDLREAIDDVNKAVRRMRLNRHRNSLSETFRDNPSTE